MVSDSQCPPSVGYPIGFRTVSPVHATSFCWLTGMGIGGLVVPPPGGGWCGLGWLNQKRALEPDNLAAPQGSQPAGQGSITDLPSTTKPERQGSLCEETKGAPTQLPGVSARALGVHSESGRLASPTSQQIRLAACRVHGHVSFLLGPITSTVSLAFKLTAGFARGVEGSMH